MSRATDTENDIKPNVGLPPQVIKDGLSDKKKHVQDWPNLESDKSLPLQDAQQIHLLETVTH